MLYERHETMTGIRHISVIVVAKNFFHLSSSVRIFENSWMTRADAFWTWAVTIFEKFCVARFAALNRARTSLIRDALWFAFESKSNQSNHQKKVNDDLPALDFWFGFIEIRKWIKAKWSAKLMSQIGSIWKFKVNQNERTRSVRFESESKQIRIKNKAIR